MDFNHYDEYKKIGLKIKELRKQKNMTQAELAEKLDISISYLTKIEAKNCRKSFSLSILFDLAEILEVNIKYFFD